jgi:hypothetical protein
MRLLKGAADQHRYVCALATAIGMELVEDKEVEAATVRDHLPIELGLTGHQELEHHEVGEEGCRAGSS